LVVHIQPAVLRVLVQENVLEVDQFELNDQVSM